MQLLEQFSLFTRPLNVAGIAYMVTGSAASMVYGEPRMTHDIDLVIELRPSDLPKLVRAFPDEDFDLPPPEVLAIERRRAHHGHFNVIHHATGFKADMYVKSSADPLHSWGFPRRRRVELSEGRSGWRRRSTSSSASWSTTAKAARRNTSTTSAGCS